MAPAKISVKHADHQGPQQRHGQPARAPPFDQPLQLGVSMLTSSNTSNPASRLGSNRNGITSSSPPKMMTQLMTSNT